MTEPETAQPETAQPDPPIPVALPDPFDSLMSARALMDAARNAAQGDEAAISAADNVVSEREVALASARDVGVLARQEKQLNRDQIVAACDATDAATAAIRGQYGA